MKTVSRSFLAAQRSESAEPLREVYFKRRKWDQATAKFIDEDDWTLIPEDQIVSVSPVTAKLDTDKLNEMKISSVSIVLKNEMNQWGIKNESGAFGKDNASQFGYEPFWTKFKIRTGFRGYALSHFSIPIIGLEWYRFDTSKTQDELVSLFTGVATDFMPDADGGTVSIPVQGLETMLINGDAENVSTRVVNEVVGTGDASTVDFITAVSGVGIIEEVSVDGIAVKIGSDCDISDLNERTLGAKITFGIAPLAGKVIRCTYRYWKQNKNIEDLVKDLLTEGGVAAVNQSVDAVTFPSAIHGTFKQDTQADWLAGTLSHTEATSVPGDVKPVFSVADQTQLLDDFSSGTPWAVEMDYPSIPIGSSSVVDGKLRATATYQRQNPFEPSYVPNYQVSLIKPITSFYLYGSWSWKFKISPLNFGGDLLTREYASIGFTLGKNGYGVLISHASSYLELGWMRRSAVTSISLSFGAGSVSAPFVIDEAEHVMAVHVSRDGYARLYVDSVLKATVPVAEYSAASYFMRASASFSPSTAGAAYVEIDDVYTAYEDITCDHDSQVHDTGTTSLGAWGRLVPNHTLGGGSITYYSNVSADGISWDGWVEVSDTGQILSAKKRYIKIRARFAQDGFASGSPVLHSYSLTYQMNSTQVLLANFTGKNCWQAIQELGAFANYEYGFLSDETFYFRKKSTDQTIKETFEHDKNLSTVTLTSNGFDRFYSAVKVTYGDYTATIKDDGLTPDSPFARCGRKTLSVDGGDILTSPDADIASGVAATVFAEVTKQKRRWKIKTKFWPQMELSDTISVSFTSYQPPKIWKLGDTAKTMGDCDLQMHGSGNQIIDNQLCKIIGARHDFDNRISEFDIEEII